MGLERHVNRVVDEAAPHLVRGYDYRWEYGMLLVREDAAQEVTKALDASDEFGPTRIEDVLCDPVMRVVRFGVYRDYYQEAMGALAEEISYAEYCRRFKERLAD